jgi:hypothetical protein
MFSKKQANNTFIMQVILYVFNCLYRVKALFGKKLSSFGPLSDASQNEFFFTQKEVGQMYKNN